MSEQGSSAPLVEKTNEGVLKLTVAGREQIIPLVTGVDDQVYSFTNEASTTMVAAAMARLSRNANDLRTIMADEFLGSGDTEKDTALLRRVVTDYGDDSVMQLDNLQLVFEGVSNIATKAIERGRFAAYLEQSTRYLRFDRRDEDGRYRYYTPEEFDDDTKALYEEKMDGIFDIYSDLYKKVRAHIEANDPTPEAERDGAWRNACHAQACDSIRSLLPSATKATVGVAGSTQAIYNMILHLESEELPELKKLGRSALSAVRQIAPIFFERIDNPERGGLISDNKETARANSRTLATDLVEQFGGIEQEPGTAVKLLATYGSEDELITKILSDNSQYSYDELAKLVAGLSDDQKQTVIKTYVGERYNRRVKPGRAFELPHYLFEVQCDFGAFRDIQRHRAVDSLEWQKLQPYLGHSRSKVIDDAGLVDEYEKAFALSQEAYELLTERGYEAQAQYATLFGHNMRFTFLINARSFTHSAELRTTPQGHPSYRKVYQQMAQEAEKVHPNIIGAMTFLSQAEDPDLARLGAERAKQRKLDELDKKA
jgi:thymidylate synthase ThyX